MKKLKLTNILLLVLPLLVVRVVTNDESLAVYNCGMVQYMSWMDMIPELPWSWCAPMAALMNYVIFALAVLWCLLKKDWCIKGIFGLSFTAATIAVLPLLVQSTVKIVPYVAGSLTLMVNCFVAYLVIKKLPEEKKNEQYAGQRLEKH